jgi:hypothetical protein
VQFLTPIQSTDKIYVEVSDDRVSWVEAGSRFPGINENATDYGIFVRPDVGTGSLQAGVTFGQYSDMFGKTTVGGAGRAWSSFGGAYYWRVVKAKSGQAVGFGKNSDGSLSLVNRYDGTTSSTFTFNGSGGTSSSKTIAHTRIGDWVTIHLPATSATTGTSSTRIASNTAIPASYRPLTASQAFVVQEIINNAAVVAAVGYGVITSTGIIEIYRDATATAFTNAANGGTNRNQVFTYYVGTGS